MQPVLRWQNLLTLLPPKVNEKRTIVEAAKTAGVDIKECRTIDPDNASVELFARLR